MDDTTYAPDTTDQGQEPVITHDAPAIGADDTTRQETQQSAFDLVDDDPEVRITQKLNQAQADNEAKQRKIDSLSYPIIQQDYLDSVRHAKEIQDKIDQTQQMLQAPAPTRQIGQMSTGEALAAAIAMLASHGNPYATGPIMEASQKNAQSRSDMDYQNQAQNYEFHRQNLLGQLKDAYSQLGDEQQRGYGFQQAQIHGAQQQDQLATEGANRVKEIDATGKNQIAVQNSKNMSKEELQAHGIIGKNSSSPQARSQAMDDLEGLYWSTGGQHGKLYSPAERAANLASNFYQNHMDQDTALKVSQGLLDIAKTDTEGAKQLHYGALDKNIESEITRRGVLNGLTSADTAKVKKQTALLDPQFQLKAALVHSQIIKNASGGASGVGPKATYARLLIQQLNVLKAKRDPMNEMKFPDPADQQRFDVLSNQLKGIVDDVGTIAKEHGAALPPSERPNLTDAQLIQKARESLKNPKANPNSIKMGLQIWGVQNIPKDLKLG